MFEPTGYPVGFNREFAGSTDGVLAIICVEEVDIFARNAKRKRTVQETDQTPLGITEREIGFIGAEFALYYATIQSPFHRTLPVR